MNKNTASQCYDFFIAHASKDTTEAEALFDLMAPHARVFIDSKNLLLGDDWDIELPKAQRASLITVVLISSFTEKAFYQREEIHAAINYARNNPETHRVIPVYIDRIDSDAVPYGLRLKHSVYLKDDVTLEIAAQRLLDTLCRLNSNISEQKEKEVAQDTGKITGHIVDSNSAAGDPNGQKLDLDRPITIKRIRKQERIDAEIIANIAFNPSGDLLAYSLDNRLYILPLTDVFPQRLGVHQNSKSSPIKSSTNYDNKGEKTNITEIVNQDTNSAHYVRITDITFSPNGELIASADNDGHINIWSVKTKKCIAELSEHFDAVTNLSFSPQGALLASASYDELIYIWKMSDIISQHSKPYRIFEKKSKIKKRAKYQHDIEQITAMTFSPSGKHLASGDQQGVVIVREIESEEEVYRKKIHNDIVTGIAFSPKNNALLATSSIDTRIRLTDCVSGELPVTLGVGDDKHQDAVISIAFSYNGDILVSSGCDRKVKLWDIEKNKLLYTYSSEDDRPIEKVAFFPNQYDFATDSYTSDISLWGIQNEGSILNTKINFE